MMHLSSHVKVTHRIAQNCSACKPWHEKTLDKRRNFIKLKEESNKKTPRSPGSGRLFCAEVGFEDGDPVAFTIEEPENVDDLSGFLDLVKSHIVLNNDKVNAKAIQKRIMDNRILIRKTIELL